MLWKEIKGQIRRSQCGTLSVWVVFDFSSRFKITCWMLQLARGPSCHIWNYWKKKPKETTGRVTLRTKVMLPASLKLGSKGASKSCLDRKKQESSTTRDHTTVTNLSCTITSLITLSWFLTAGRGVDKLNKVMKCISSNQIKPWPELTVALFITQLAAA